MPPEVAGAVFYAEGTTIGSGAPLAREAALEVAAKRAAILGTDLPDLKVSLDSLAVLEQTMRHFYIKAIVEKSLGENADWKAVDAAMVQAAALAEKVAAFRHPKLSAVRLAGELNKSPTNGATLDELLARIKTQCKHPVKAAG